MKNVELKGHTDEQIPDVLKNRWSQKKRFQTSTQLEEQIQKPKHFVLFKRMFFFYSSLNIIFILDISKGNSNVPLYCVFLNSCNEFYKQKKCFYSGFLHF